MFNINKYSSKDIYNWKNTNVICLYVKIQNNKFTYKKINNGYDDRAESIIKMITDTLEKYTINDLEIYINLMDKPINNMYFLQVSNTTNCKVNTIPSYSFYEWKEAKLKNFFSIKKDILNNQIEWDKKINKILWSGTDSSEIRKKFNSLKTNEMYEYNLINYDVPHKYYDLNDHTKYKYLLDLEGVGYSNRFPYLALTGSCIIYIENLDPDRDFKLYYDKHFIEDIHYIKISYNSNDTIDCINNKICNKINNSNCKKIAEDCQKVALDLFVKDKILLYMSEILNYYASNYVNINEILNPDSIYCFLYITNKLKKILINSVR
jgi:hypothetical protein